MPSAKAVGRAAEVACVEDLENTGHLAFRTHLSRGPVDVVALSSLGTRLIQVKARTNLSGGSLSKPAIERMKEEVEPWLHPQTTFELWIRGKVNGRWKWVRQERLL